MNKDGFAIEVSGFKELAKALSSLSKELGERGINRSIRKAGKFLQEKIKNNTPEQTGNLKSGIEFAMEKESGVESTAVVYSHKKKAFHAHLVEYGHRLVSENGKQVGFVKPHPYFRPAIDENEKAVLKIIEDDLRRAFDRAVRKLKRGR